MEVQARTVKVLLPLDVSLVHLGITSEAELRDRLPATPCRIEGRITAVQRTVTLLYLMSDMTNNHPCQNAACSLNVDLLLSESVARVKLSANRTTCEGKNHC